MKIRLIGSGSQFCRHPLVPVTLLVQTPDGGNMVINCPPQISAKLESINMSISDVDVWVLTSADVFYSGGIEEVCNTQTKKSLVLSATSSVMDEIRKKYAPSRGSNKRVSEVITPSIRLEDDNYDERVVLKGNSVAFENSKIVLTNIFEIGEYPGAELILCNVNNGSPDLSVEFDCLRELPLYIQSKIWIVGYGNQYQSIEDPLPIMFMPQGTCVFDNERKEPLLSKERFIVNDGKRIAGNKSKL